MDQKRQVPRSERFEDVYFSAENGMEETKHVFLNGNNVPVSWEGKKRFVICETGFGTGLNFLITFSLFNRKARNGQHLEFISFEKYPVRLEKIKIAHSCWSESFQSELDLLLAHYPKCTPGTHHLKLSSYVSLTLIIADVNEVMPKLNAKVDCWYLDGFKPSTNPEMWSDTVFQNMARLSKAGTTFATFTAAGKVRRGLLEAGFDVQKVPGYGRKREMLVGIYKGHEDNIND